MLRKFLTPLLLSLVIVTASAFYLAGVAGVPFHPDETTQLYMSADLETLLRDPLSLAWQPGESDQRGHYRLMDAPLPRTWIGLGRMLAGQPAPLADWDWTLDWKRNLARGALPGQDALLAGRWMMALCYPFSLLLAFLAGRRLGRPIAGWTALLLTATNALVLLHTRRAMAEGLLLLLIYFNVWWLSGQPRHPWLVGAWLALAFLAKQSAAALLLPAALALLTPLGGELQLAARLRNTLAAAGLFVGLVVLCNPFAWAHPVGALQAALRERAAFAQAQEQAHSAQGGVLLASSPAARLAGVVAQWYITEPAVMDVDNYRDALADASARYLGNPVHRLLRGFAGGGVLFLLTLFGAVTTGMRAARERRVRAEIWLLLAAGVAQVGVLLLIPVPFQRYAVALVPHAALWVGIGAANVAAGFQKNR